MVFCSVSARHPGRQFGAAVVAFVATLVASGAASAQRLPEIRTSAQNRVPACVTPDRLQVFLAERNDRLDARFNDIARYYKQHGETQRVRWDYAFFQMMLETNSLKFGRDVSPRQNNFAGLGATGGGVPGERFRDVSTGVLAHLQHLVAYSGEEVAKPAAQRTAEVQSDVIAKSRRLGRPVTFSDLTNRWAMDRGYARKIDAIADEFREQVCARAPAPPPAAEALPSAPPAVRQPSRRVAAPVPPAGLASPSGVAPGAPTATGALPPRADPVAVPPTGPIQPNGPSGKPGPELAAGAPKAPARPPGETDLCRVVTASFGGATTLLIKAVGADNKITYTALGVVDGQEQAMAQAYMAKHAPGGSIVGQFMSRDAAVAQAYQKCDSGRH